MKGHLVVLRRKSDASGVLGSWRTFPAEVCLGHGMECQVFPGKTGESARHCGNQTEASASYLLIRLLHSVAPLCLHPWP